MLQQLKPEYIEKILADELLRVKIAQPFKKSGLSVYRWAKKNHYNLTVPAVLDIIREHEGLAADTELTEERQAVAA